MNKKERSAAAKMLGASGYAAGLGKMTKEQRSAIGRKGGNALLKAKGLETDEQKKAYFSALNQGK